MGWRSLELRRRKTHAQCTQPPSVIHLRPKHEMPPTYLLTVPPSPQRTSLKVATGSSDILMDCVFVVLVVRRRREMERRRDVEVARRRREASGGVGWDVVSLCSQGVPPSSQHTRTSQPASGPAPASQAGHPAQRCTQAVRSSLSSFSQAL